MYNDNLHEMDQMKEFVSQFGFQFMVSWARTITLENTIQSLRKIDQDAGVDVPKFNLPFPPSNPEFEKNMDRLRFHPKKARELYNRFPVSSVCVVGDVFTYIRHDGKVQLCAWCDDRRLILGDYLSMTQDQISEARRGHPLCSECLRYRLNLFYHVCDCTKWDGIGERFNQ